MTPRALEGLRVVETGDFISAAYAGKLLADLGADVIKVEPPEGDSARRHGPFAGDVSDPEQSGLFLFLNTNKRSVVLDLESEAGRERLRALAREADIVVHNHRASDLRRWGLTYEDLSADHPELVMSAITPFGHGTPRADWEGTALTATAASGLPNYIGDADRAPLWLPFSAADFQGGVHGAAAALLAYRERRASGKGQHVWVSIQEIMGSMLGGSGLPLYVYGGQIRGRAGVHMNAFYPWQVVPVADGYFEVITMVDEQWRRFVALMGDPAWGEDERLQNRWVSFQWKDELDPLWHPWLRDRSKAELWELFKKERIPFQPVQSMADMVQSDHLASRGFFVETEHAAAATVRMPGAPYRLSATPWSLRGPAPLLDADGGEALVDPWRRAGLLDHQTGGVRAEGSRPLSGIRVLDHGHVWAGPLLAQMLGEMGADVVKVQSPSRSTGIDMGGVSASKALQGAEDATADDPEGYHGWERNKRSVTLDLASERGREIYLRLVAESDVIVENFAPRVMPSLGLGYEALRAVNPGIIMAALSATGATEGPWRDLVTYGPSLGALYGLKSVQGYRDDPQPREDRADLDPTSAAHAFVAVLAALEFRERTGEGQFLDVAQGECAMQRIAEPLMDYLLNGRVAGPQGNRRAGIAPHGVYRTAGDDSWIAIVARNDAEWSALRGVAGEAAGELHADRFAHMEERLANQDALDAAIERWTSSLDAAELCEALQAVGVPASPVMTPPMLLADANMTALRDAGVVLESPGSVQLDQIFQGVVWKLERTPGHITVPAPRLGQHTDEVLRERLSLSDGELASLRESGVI